jgi:hypothetical protein
MGLRAASFDHLVRRGDKRQRDRYVPSLGGAAIGAECGPRLRAGERAGVRMQKNPQVL